MVYVRVFPPISSKAIVYNANCFTHLFELSDIFSSFDYFLTYGRTYSQFQLVNRWYYWMK